MSKWLLQKGSYVGLKELTHPSAQVLDKVKSIVSKQLGVEEEKVTESSKFVDDLGADSLDAVEMVMALEDEFGVEIGEESAEKLASVQARHCLQLIHSLLELGML